MKGYSIDFIDRVVTYFFTLAILWAECVHTSFNDASYEGFRIQAQVEIYSRIPFTRLDFHFCDEAMDNIQPP